MRLLLPILALGAAALGQTPVHTPHNPHLSNAVVLYGAEGYTPSNLWDSINTWLGSRFDWILGGGGTGDAHGGNLTKAYYSAYLDGPEIATQQGYMAQTFANANGFTLENVFLHANLDSAVPAYTNTQQFDAFESYLYGTNTLVGGVFTYSGGTYADVSNGSWSGSSTAIASTLYVGYLEPFDQMNFVISTPRTGGTVTYNYWNGSAWTALSSHFSDGTSGLTATGKVYWYPPADWAQRTLPVNVTTPAVITTTNPKFWVQIIVSGASVSPIYSTVKGDDWSISSAGNTFRGWNTTDANRINVGTRLEYNPTPPANASAKFRYQARATDGGNQMFGNPSDIQGGVRTWGAWLAYDTDALLNPTDNFDSIFFDDAGNQPKNADATLDYNHTEGWTVAYGAVHTQLMAQLKAEHGSAFWITNNSQQLLSSGHMIGDANLIEAIVMPGDWYTVSATINPYPNYVTPPPNGGAPYDYFLAATNPNNVKGYAQYYDQSSLVASSSWSPQNGYMSNWHFADRANRTPLLTLAMHYMGSNPNTGFMYHGGEENINSQYITVDQVDTYDVPTTLVSPVSADTSANVKTIPLTNTTTCVGEVYPDMSGVVVQIGASGDVVKGTFGQKVIINTNDVTLQTWGGNPTTLANSWPNRFQIGYTAPFGQVSFVLANPGTRGTGANWTYWNGSSWAVLTVTDGTATFDQSGTVTFTPPGDWATTSVSGVTAYWIAVAFYYTNPPTLSTVRSPDWKTLTTTSPIYNSYSSGTAAYCVQSQHLAAITTPSVANVWGWTRWFPAMGVDIGSPDPNGYRGGVRAIDESGNAPWLYGIAISGHTPLSGCSPGSCPNVWRRDFTKAIILFRPWRSGVNLESELDTPSQPIALGGSYSPLKADGTEGPPVTSVSLRGGEGAILMKSATGPAVICNAGQQQTLRAGFPAQLDGSGSSAADGSQLSYLWQEFSGPSRVTWSSRTVAQPVVTRLVAGSYVFQLTVQEGASQPASCTVKQGVVATSDNGVVITKNAAVDTLLGMLPRVGTDAWPWYDDRYQASANLQIAAMDVNYPAWWDAPGPGTVMVFAGSKAIVGAATAFTTTFCQGPSFPYTPKSNAVIAVWYQTGVSGQTGRRMSSVTSCSDDTHMTVDDAWDVGAIPAGSGLSYASDDASTHYATNWGWGQANLPGNYEDNVAAYYALYYRSGIDDYLSAAQKLADRVWRSPMVDRGASLVPGHSGSYGYPARSLAALGLVLRAAELQGSDSDMWPGLHKIWDWSMGYLSGATPGTADTLEKASHLAMVSYCALLDSDAAYRANCTASISGSFGRIWTPWMASDGSWPSLYYTSSSWDTGTSASTVNGSTTVTGNGTNWQAGSFPCTIWLTTSPGQKPADNLAGDATTYAATFVDATHLTLNRPYQGNNGTHGWALAGGMIGWGARPSDMGRLAAAFDLASKALAGTDATDSGLASTYNAAAANWIKTYGYWTLQKGLYDAVQGVNCQAPINDGNAACTAGNSAEQARALSAEALRGLMAAYSSSQSQDLSNFLDGLFSAMFAKPGTCPSGSSACVPDGTYLSGMDDGGSMMTGTPPQGNEWFGTFFGFNDLSAWSAYRDGGLPPASWQTYYVSFSMGAVRGAEKVRISATEPSGAIVQTECASSPCAVAVDGRQGRPLIDVIYLSNSEGVLARTAFPL